MEPKHIYSSDDKLKWWGYGEWVEEADQVKFEHEDFQCLVKRIVAFEANGSVFGGHFCGYVVLPENHPWRNQGWSEIGTDVHGGITFNEGDPHGEIKEHLVGFDCAHSTDITPSMQKYFNPPPEYMKNMYKLFTPTYKNINFAIEETKKLAEEAKKALDDHA